MGGGVAYGDALRKAGAGFLLLETVPAPLCPSPRGLRRRWARSHPRRSSRGSPAKKNGCAVSLFAQPSRQGAHIQSMASGGRRRRRQGIRAPDAPQVQAGAGGTPIGKGIRRAPGEAGHGSQPTCAGRRGARRRRSWGIRRTTRSNYSCRTPCSYSACVCMCLRLCLCLCLCACVSASVRV